MSEKGKMDAIVKAFQNYIQEQDYFDILYSEKIGYLRILVHSPEEGAVVLNTPETMLEYLCGDIISDVIYSPDNPKKSHSDLLLTEYEKAESCRRLTLIFETMGLDKSECFRLAEQYIKDYQGDTDEEE